MTLGAGRGRLVTQLMTESLVLALVAGVAGVVVAHFGARILAALVPESLSAPGLARAGINGGCSLFTLAVTIVTALACGVSRRSPLRCRTRPVCWWWRGARR